MRSSSLLSISLFLYTSFLSCLQEAFAAESFPDEVRLECANPGASRLKLEAVLKKAPGAIQVELASENQSECGSLTDRAVEVAPDVDILGVGSASDEVPNGDFHRWGRSGPFSYAAPTYGRADTYEGTGGRRVESASCWKSKVWGLYGGGVIARRQGEEGIYLNWQAKSVRPPDNDCGGRRARCDDDPDATGFHHVEDRLANKIVRDGTAGQSLSQMIPVDRFFDDWVTVRVSMRNRGGNGRFYVRLLQGYGRNDQLSRSVGLTLPGITLAPSGRLMDYVLAANLKTKMAPMRQLGAPQAGQRKYVQISLESATPELDHDVDVFRISLYRGIGAPSSSRRNSAADWKTNGSSLCN